MDQVIICTNGYETFVNVKVKRLTESAILPKYSREGDACLDLYSDKNMEIKQFETGIVPTNIAIELPKGFEAQVRGRSGISSQSRITHLGTIDSNYRGSIGVIITNLNSVPYCINKGDRIAQLAIRETLTIKIIEVEQVSETNRGDKGFGSSGV